ncbi:hypothetical protein HD554DRAFT_2171596 [Boletus coccyginus]|nr:hypothetical protein HD554DRAFT_2171596 [Boletus coccyginus]
MNALLPKKKSNGKKHLCRETYKWVKTVYNLVSNSLHALTMDTDMRTLTIKLVNMSCEEHSKKGMSHVGLFMTMVSAFVIMMMDNSSPLMECMLGDNAELRADKVNKHVSKGISVSNVLLRFHLAKLLSPKVNKSAKWLHNARPLDLEEIQMLWGHVRQCFVQNKEYGSYDTAVLLAGEHTSKQLLSQGTVKTRGQVEMSSTSTSGSGKGKGKRVREEEPDNDNDSDLLIMKYIPDGCPGSSSVHRRTHY